MGKSALLRRIVPQRLRTWIKGLLHLPQTHLQPDWQILAPIGPVQRPHTVIDVGAFVGWFFHSWLDWCPQATIHAFEPAPETYRNLVQKYANEKRVIICNQGVGDSPGELTLKQMSASPASNSFLDARKETWEKIQYETGEVIPATVKVTTLDDYCRANALRSIYLLKIDVQGFELNVLRGAKESLRIIDHILVESAIQTLYEGGARFTDVCTFMMSHGFHLANLRAWHRGNHVLMETDLLFRRNDLMPPISTAAEKVYI